MALPDGLDFLYGPVHEGWITAAQLLDGSVDLRDVAELNDVLAVLRENQWRMSQKT